MISVQQIKAARGLLEWSQVDLAKAAGLHVNAINNVERRHGLPRADTMEAIQKAFEERGIRFKGLTGVNLVQETLEIQKITGPQFIRTLTDDLLFTLRTPKDELLAVMPDEKFFMLDPHENDRYYKAQKRAGFKHRLILSDAYAESYGDERAVRFLPAAVMGKVSYQVYGDKFVLVNWHVPEMVIMRSASVAESFRQQFEYLWSQAAPFKPKKKSRR